jgi:hypothetical protein
VGSGFGTNSGNAVYAGLHVDNHSTGDLIGVQARVAAQNSTVSVGGVLLEGVGLGYAGSAATDFEFCADLVKVPSGAWLVEASHSAGAGSSQAIVGFAVGKLSPITTSLDVWVCIFNYTGLIHAGSVIDLYGVLA